MMSRPAGRDTELRRWGTPYVNGGGLSNCWFTAAFGGGGNLGGGEGVEAARNVSASSPLSLSAHCMFSNPTDTACYTDHHNVTRVVPGNTQTFKTHIINLFKHEVHLNTHSTQQMTQSITFKTSKVLHRHDTIPVELQPQISYLRNILSSDCKILLAGQQT
jgi:hypothetical protein